MKKTVSDHIVNDVVKKIVNGEISIQDLECLFNGETISGNRVLRSIDVMSDGSFRKHETTEEEVLGFVIKHPRYDEFMDAITTERKKYSQRADRARKARTKVGKSAQKDTDKNAPTLDPKGSDVSVQLSDPPISNATVQIDNKVEANNSCGVETTESVDNSAETPVEPSSVQG